MYSQVATLVLHNRDHGLDDINLKGYEAVVSYGVVTSAGEEYSATASLSVVDQQFDSDPNNLICTLFLQGIPNLMAEDEASASYIPASDDIKTVKQLVEAIAEATLAPFTHTKAFEVVWDVGYDALADTYLPKDGFRIYEGGKRLAAFRRVLDYTANVPRFEADGKIHILKAVTSGTTYDSEYSLAKGSHTFFKKAYRETLVIPNRFVVKSLPDDSPAYEGSAQVSDYASLPDSVKKTRFVRVKLASNDEGDDIAAALLSKAETGCARGSAEVPLNCGSEVFDYVKITDSRQGDSRTGNLGYVHRRFGGDKWTMTFGFGNWLESLRYQAVLKGLENYTDAGQYFSRLSVGDLYVEHILADNVDFVWIDPDNTIDLSKIGDNLDNLPDGETYVRTRSMHLDASGVYLEENTLYSLRVPGEADKNLTKGTTAPTEKATGDIWVDTNYTPNKVKMWTGSAWVELTAEQLAAFNRGSIFRRVKTASLTADGLILLDQVQVGTYGLVNSTDISAGHIKLDTVVTGTHGLVLATDITAGHIKLSTCSGNLDDIGNGSTYEKMRGTDIYSGHIDLTSSLYAHGIWYDYSGVIIDADTGIELHGGSVLSIYTPTDIQRGCIGAEGTDFVFTSLSFGADIVLEPDYDVVFIVDSPTYSIHPSLTSDVYLGDSAYYWGRVYSYVYYGKLTSIYAFQDHDDIAMLRSIKSKDGKLDANSFPQELTETDEEMQIAYDKAVAKLNDNEQRLATDCEELKRKKKEAENEPEDDDEKRERKQKKLKDLSRNIKATEEAITKFQKRKPKVLKSLDENKKTKGVNMGNWQSLIMGSVLQLADKVDALEKKIG
jgi:hypothetical protein